MRRIIQPVPAGWRCLPLTHGMGRSRGRTGTSAKSDSLSELGLSRWTMEPVMLTDKRSFILYAAAGFAGVLGSRSSQAQGPAAPVGGQRFFAGRPAIPHRQAKTTALFRGPPGGYPNALAPAPEGLWIAQQKISGSQRLLYDLPEPGDPTEVCWLVDWQGKLLKTVHTDSRGTAGVAWDGKYLWTGADNNEVEGIFKSDLSDRTISRHQIPLRMASDGGPCHG